MAHVSFFSRLPVRVTGLALLLGVLILPALTELRRRAVEALVFGGAETQALVVTNAVVSEINAVQQSVEKVLRYVAADLELRSEITPAEIDRIVRNVLAVSSEIYGCTVAFEPRGLDAKTERFGHYLRRHGKGLQFEDLAAPGYQYWTKDWYREALASTVVGWSEPFYDAGGADANVVRATMPVFRSVNGQRVAVGVVAAGVELGWLRKVALRNMPFATGFVMIFSRSGRLILHPQSEFIIKETMDSLAKSTRTPELALIRQQVIAKRQGAMAYFSGALDQRVRVHFKPSWGQRGGGVVVGFQEAEFAGALSEYHRITWISLAATLAAFGAIVGVVSFLLLRPLGQLAHAAEEIAAGRLDGTIPPVRREDELGRLARALAALRQRMRMK